MHGDFSRMTFDPAHGYRAVLLQQGRVLLDAEANEQAAITAHHDEVRTLDAVGPSGGPADGAGWALVDGGGAPAAATPWSELHLSAGRYYVDGVLVESEEQALGDQPFLPVVGDLPGLVEPTDDGRYAAVLDVFTHQVTGDEDPSLLESALGGPDTATRARTVWQVRLQPVADGTACPAVTEPGWGARSYATMTALLADDVLGDDCEITTAGGYRLLENQLYRVQVHTVAGDGSAQVLWSRENGSVVAALVAMGPATAATHDAVLTVDREGRDDELSITDGSLVEVTSVDRQLHGLPGYLGTAVAPSGTTVPVSWSGAAPASVAALGGTPLVRRWDGGPVAARAAATELEGGISVRFGAGDRHVGDYWLIPARTVRLVYGVGALGGTIEWPTDAGGHPLPRPPHGVAHHVAVVALLDRTTVGGAGRWTLASDCRRLFPSLTELVTLDLLGGDGQESAPGSPLPEPVRVVVRNGGLPVAGAQVRFDTEAGHLAEAPDEPGVADPSTVQVSTDADGYAEVRWRLAEGGPDTQVLTAVRLDGAGDPVGAQVRVTGNRDAGGGSTCIVVAAGTDLAGLLAELSGRDELSLCLAAGEWRLERPAVLREVGVVRIGGLGAATRLISGGESALRLEDCADVHVSDLHVASVPVEGSQNVAGALAVLRARRVHLERVSARVGGASRRMAAGISVGGYRDGGTGVVAERVVVRDCLVEAGDLQTGIVVTDARRTDVEGTVVRAWRERGSVTAETLPEWLADRSFARLVAQRAIAPTPGGRPDPGPRTGFGRVVPDLADAPFTTEIVSARGTADTRGWREYLADGESRDVLDIQRRVRDDLASARADSRFFDDRTLFGGWLAGVAEDLASGPVAGRGIVVAGSVGEEIRVTDCTVSGALLGVVTALSDADPDLEVVTRVALRGNTVVPPQRSAVGFTEQAMYVGNVDSLLVHGNEVRAPGELGYAVDGVLCVGRLGPHAVVAANTFDGVAVGIRVIGGQVADATRLWVARDNVSTAGPVLVDGTGLWRSEGNVP